LHSAGRQNFEICIKETLFVIRMFYGDQNCNSVIIKQLHMRTVLGK